MADPRVIASVAGLTPGSIGPGGVLAAGRAQAAQAAVAAFIASVADSRHETMQRVPAPFFWGDVLNPYPVAPYIPGPGATGYAAAPVLPTLAK